MMCNMSDMKKMIASHRAMCDIVGMAMGIMLGFLIANTMVNKCCPTHMLKKKAKKAFRCIEDKMC